MLRPLLLALLLSVPAFASAAEEIEEILVTGEQPGPGLWKVTQADHVLWILGAVTPLPKKLQWRSRQVERVIAGSQEVIGEAQVHPSVGFFRTVTLLPALIKMRENSSGQTLQQILPSDLYARWERQKLRFMPHDSGVERWRPMFAAQELYQHALDRSGLSQRSVIWPTVLHLAHEHNVTVRKMDSKVHVDDPKQMIRDFNATPRDLDVACLRATVERLEQDLDGMKQRAQAWSTGDLEMLRQASFVDRDTACIQAATAATSINQRYEAVRSKVFDDWVAAAMSALANNRSSFAVLPMAEIFLPDGRLERLRRRGYHVEAPPGALP
jgi:uncharacterized protein YbaP (TraB family)